MASLVLAVGLAGLIGTSAAAEYVWSSVGFILNGERTPSLGYSTPSSLTPIGAQQLYSQGQLFRARYLNSTLTDADFRLTSHTGLQNIERNAIDNSQLSIVTSTDSYAVLGAQAFMQGLYPPLLQAFASGAGGMPAAIRANGSLVNYPLDGYQYPRILTLSSQDSDSVWLEGHVGCVEYQQSVLDMSSDTNIQTMYNRTLDFYRVLWTKLLYKATPLSGANFYNAKNLYDFARYQYDHVNGTSSTITAAELTLLGDYAGIQQQDINANLSVSGFVEGDMIRAIAGRTLAAKIVSLFKLNIDHGGSSNMLNLMFGSHEPFIAFFALAGLSNGPSAATFQGLPSPGAAMVFELFSNSDNTNASAVTYPTNINDLWVRFLYRNGTDDSTPFMPYALFGDGNENTRIRFTEFAEAMMGIAVRDLPTWCDMCGAISTWCYAFNAVYGSGSGSGSGSSSTVDASNKTVSSAVAGIIGAATTLAVVAMFFLAAILLGGLRFQRAGHDKQRTSSLGGFKGAEKMPSDADVAYASRSGARHERIGSWELRGGGASSPGGAKSVEEGVVALERPLSTATIGALVKKDLASHGRGPMKPLEDDEVSLFNQTPVKPREF